MPRHAQVLSDPESDDEGPGDKEPEEAVSETSESESDEEEIVYESEVDGALEEV